MHATTGLKAVARNLAHFRVVFPCLPETGLIRKITQGAEAMKVFRIVIAAVAFAAFAILAQTQTRPAGAPANIAIIDSSAFSDEKTGIARAMVAMQQIEAKFTPLRTELRGMRERLNTMRSDIQKKRQVQEPTLTAQQTEAADRIVF